MRIAMGREWKTMHVNRCWGSLWAAAIAMSAGCVAGSGPVPCEVDGRGAFFSWAVDGVPGEACSTELIALASAWETGTGDPVLRYELGMYEATEGSYPPPPFCSGALLTLYEVDPSMPASGVLAPNRDGLNVTSEPFVHFGVGECGGPLSTVTAGTWRIVEGGGLGDPIVVEVTGATFRAASGETLSIPRWTWHGRLPAEITHP